MNPLNLTLPNLPLNLIISLVISILIGFVFSFFRGASLGRLIISVAASIAGFYLGQFIATVFHWNFRGLDCRVLPRPVYRHGLPLELRHVERRAFD